MSTGKLPTPSPRFRLERPAEGLLDCFRDQDREAIVSYGGVLAEGSISLGLLAMHETKRVLRKYYCEPRPRHLSLEGIMARTQKLQNRRHMQALTLPIKEIVDKPYHTYGTKLSVVVDDRSGVLAGQREEYVKNLCKVTGISDEMDEFVPDIKIAEVSDGQLALDSVLSVINDRIATSVNLLPARPGPTLPSVRLM